MDRWIDVPALFSFLFFFKDNALAARDHAGPWRVPPVSWALEVTQTALIESQGINPAPFILIDHN